MVISFLLSCSNSSKKEDYYNRGDAKLKLKDYKNAILDYNKAMLFFENDMSVIRDVDE